jgi:FkbM family methyltransferase
MPGAGLDPSTMKAALKSLTRAALRAVGQTTVSIQQTYEASRTIALKRLGIDLVIDVGANNGQYAEALRASGYEGHILSLEPLPDAYRILADSRRGDPAWQGFQAAAGPAPGTAIINISADTVCSSLLQPLERLTQVMPSAQTIASANVDVVRIDDLDLPTHKRAALKLDVQGFEKQAMLGAVRTLRTASLLEIELAIDVGYEGAYTLVEALPDISALGFEIISIGRGYADPATGRLIDADILFERCRAA